MSRRKSTAVSAPRPVQVVRDDGTGRRIVEVHEALELPADPIRPVGDGVGGVHRALPHVPRIADQAGRSAGEDDRTVARALESFECEQRHEVTGVQARSGRIEAGIQGDRTCVEIASECVEIGRLGNEPAPGQFVENVLSHRSIIPFVVRSAGARGLRRYAETAGRARNPQTPRPVCGDADPDARAGGHVDVVPSLGQFEANPRPRGEYVETVVGDIQSQCRGEVSGSACKLVGRHPRGPSPARALFAVHDLAAAQQHGGGHAVGSDRDVRAQMQAVAAVDVQMAGGSEHHGVARARPPIRMSGGVGPRTVLRSAVRLDLGEPNRDIAHPDHRTEQRTSRLDRIEGFEVLRAHRGRVGQSRVQPGTPRVT